MLRLYSDKSYEKVNKKNKRLLKDYELELKMLGKSEGTIKQYVFDIKAFYCYLVDYCDNEYVLDLKKRAFRNFFLTLQDAGCSNARVNRVQSSLRNLLQFAEDDEDLYEDYVVNPMRKIKGLAKESVRKIHFISDDKMVILLQKLLEKGLNLQALAFMVAYESAGRRNEIAQITKKSLLEGEYLTNEVTGKRSKKFHLIYFNDVRELAKEVFKDDQEGLAFGDTVESARNKLYYWTLKLRELYEELFGEYVEFNFHSFRHSALDNLSTGTHYYLRENNKEALSINALKTLANHENLTTTESYLVDRSQELLIDELGIKKGK